MWTLFTASLECNIHKMLFILKWSRLVPRVQNPEGLETGQAESVPIPDFGQPLYLDSHFAGVLKGDTLAFVPGNCDSFKSR